MANIRDIAKITGYSVTTISRVINHHPYVDEKKRQKVLEVMEELDYVPNRTAQNLSHGKTHTIGIILPFTNHPYYDQLLSGMVKAAFDRSYQVTLLPTNYNQELEKEYLDQFATKEFDGLIVATRSNPVDVFLPYLKYGPIIFGEATPGYNVACAYIDLESSLTQALNYFIEAGVKRLGLVLGRSKNLSYNSKLTLQLCEALMPGFEKENIYWDSCSGANGLAASEFFKERAVDGILANGDEIAAIIYRSYTTGMAPLIVGRENLLLSEVLGFSTIDHHLEECGKMAFELFEQNRIEQVKMPCTFIRR